MTSAESGTAEAQVEKSQKVVEVEDLHKTFVMGFLPYRRVSRLLERLWPRGANLFYRRVKAVQGLSFEVKKGEVFGLLGPNGAGKTTTLKMMMGLIFPDKGSVKIFGHKPGSLMAKKEIGFLPENPYFYEYLKAGEFLSLVAALTGVPLKNRKKRISKMVDMVGLSHATDRPLRKFSKGMLQRIGLAQALLSDPQLVVLDEPLSGLDPMGRKEIRDIVRGLKGEGKTVLFSSHILSDVEMLCDRVAILAKGKIRKIGPLEALLSGGEDLTEVVFEGSKKDIEKIMKGRSSRCERIGEKVRFVTEDRSERDGLLKEAILLGLSVESVVPRRSSLEDLFMLQTKEKTSLERDEAKGKKTDNQEPKE